MELPAHVVGPTARSGGPRSLLPGSDWRLQEVGRGGCSLPHVQGAGRGESPYPVVVSLFLRVRPPLRVHCPPLLPAGRGVKAVHPPWKASHVLQEPYRTAPRRAQETAYLPEPGLLGQVLGPVSLHSGARHIQFTDGVIAQLRAGGSGALPCSSCTCYPACTCVCCPVCCCPCACPSDLMGIPAGPRSILIFSCNLCKMNNT